MAPIYYINLASRPDRRAFMEDQFAALGLGAARIEAVTPAELSQDEIAAHCDRSAFRFLRETELACTLSHEKAWKAMLADGHEAALILEDDAVLSAALPRFLAQFDPRAHDLVRLEAVRRARILPATSVVAETFHLHPFRSTFMGACGYVLGAGAASFLLSAPELRQQHLDLAIFNTFEAPGRYLDKRLVAPALCIQAGDREGATGGVASSDIDTPAAKREAEQARPLRFLVRRALSHALTRLRNVLDHILHLPRGLKTRAIPLAQG